MDKALRLLIVDDEHPIRRFLNASLSGQYIVLEAANGMDALASAATARPDIIILDIGLPDIDGVQVTRRLREWTQIPIIVISVHEQEADKIAALDAGADDYLVKPFSIGELTARLRVAMRHATFPDHVPVFKFGTLTIDLAHRYVLVDGRQASLTPTEYDILRILVQHAGKVLTHQQILHSVWGSAFEAESHLLRVNVSNLRRKIEPDPSRPRYLVTEPGVGYRLKSD